MTELIAPCAKCGNLWASVEHANGNGNSYWSIVCENCHTESTAEDSFEAAVSAWNHTANSRKEVTDG
jgi:hypothetical protein